MKLVNRIVFAFLLLLLVYLSGYRLAAQPILGLAIEQNGRELFVPRYRLNCDSSVESCSLHLNQGFSIDLTKNLSTLPGNCSAVSPIAKGSLHDGRYQCSTHMRGHWNNESAQRRVIVLTGIELSGLQTARMQVESWLVAIAMGVGAPFQLFLVSLSSVVGLQVAQTLFALQRGWGTRRSLALFSASGAGAMVAAFGWLPLFIVAEIMRFGSLY